MYDSFLALGDSFTEGLEDRRPDGSVRGWADRVAAELARLSGDFRYANLAVRGRRLAHVREQQLPRAEALRPALVTLAAGGNDILGLRCDVPALGAEMHELLRRPVATGADVLVFTGFDTRGKLPVGRLLAARTEAYNVATRRSADQLGVRVIDLWALPGLDDSGSWAADRLHLSSAGHALVADAVLAELGVDRPPAPAGTGVQVPAQRGVAADVDWARRYLAPWVGRKVRGRSTGDAVEPKLPELTPLPACCAPPQV